MKPTELNQVLAQHAEWLADPTKGKRANLRHADLRSADLICANLRNADLSVANLRGANLYDADLRYANLRGANLRGADLRYANLHIADLRDANLRYADLRGANLSGADLCGASVDPVAWVEAHERAIFLNFTQDRWVMLWKSSTYVLPAEWQPFWELYG